MCAGECGNCDLESSVASAVRMVCSKGGFHSIVFLGKKETAFTCSVGVHDKAELFLPSATREDRNIVFQVPSAERRPPAESLRVRVPRTRGHAVQFTVY